MHFPAPIICLLFCFLLGNSKNVEAQLNTTAEGRIESEFKLSVPKEIEEEVWKFLITEFDDAGMKIIDTSFSTIVAQEIFYDLYFDNEEKRLFDDKAGVRFRQRYVADTLSKQLIQLKLPLNDTTGVARQEIKFNVYTKVKNKDRLAMHPFWKYVRPKNREAVNLHLANHELTGNDLTPSVKVRQDRKRIYIAENGIPFLTMTFDEVCSFYFPYPCYTELELELNEIRFTEGNLTERSRMENINQSIKEKIMTRFPRLEQDQTPKYNKMYLLLKDNFLEKIYNNLMYIAFGTVVFFACLLFLQDQKIHR